MRTTFPPIPPALWTIDLDQLMALVRAAFVDRFGEEALLDMDWNHFPDGYVVILRVRDETPEMRQFSYDFGNHLLAHGVPASVRCRPGQPQPAGPR